MLSDEQIKEEARKRLQNMSPDQRRAIESEILEEIDILQIAREKGIDNLTPAQKAKFHNSAATRLRKQHAGGLIGKSTEDYVMEKFNVSRDEVKTMKKNPFKAGMLRQVLYVVLANLGLATVVGIDKATGMDLKAAELALGGLSGLFAYGFGEKLMDVIRFRKMQKGYESEEYQDKEIDAEVYKTIRDEVERSRGM